MFVFFKKMSYLISFSYFVNIFGQFHAKHQILKVLYILFIPCNNLWSWPFTHSFILSKFCNSYCLKEIILIKLFFAYSTYYRYYFPSLSFGFNAGFCFVFFLYFLFVCVSVFLLFMLVHQLCAVPGEARSRHWTS